MFRVRMGLRRECPAMLARSATINRSTFQLGSVSWRELHNALDPIRPIRYISMQCCGAPPTRRGGPAEMWFWFPRFALCARDRCGDMIARGAQMCILISITRGATCRERERERERARKTVCCVRSDGSIYIGTAVRARACLRHTFGARWRLVTAVVVMVVVL